MTLQGISAHLTITPVPSTIDSLNSIPVNISASCFSPYDESDGITASLSTWFWLEALERLYDRLLELNESLQGELVIERFEWENDFDFRITYDGLGHATVKTNLNYRNGNRCTLEFETDQTCIAVFLKEMKVEMAQIIPKREEP